MITRLLATGLMLAAALATGVASAQTAARPVGKLMGVQGSVLVSAADAMAAASNGQALAPGVRIITTAGASATVVYDKGCEVKLGENRRYTVREQAECSVPAAPNLGAATGFAVLAGARVPSGGETLVQGNLGVSPGAAVTGFPPGRVTGGTIHAADELAANAQKDAAVAYADLASQPCNTRLTGQDLGGQTLTPGAYCFPSSAAKLTGELVLDAQGDVAAVFLFQVGTTLTTAEKASVRVINGGLSCNVFWQVGDSAALGKDTKFAGNIMAMQSVTAGSGVSLTGRVVVRTGAVSMDTTTIDALPCVAVVPPGWYATPGGVLAVTAGAVAVGAGVYEATKSKSPN